MSSINSIKLGIIWKRLNGMIDEVAESFIRSSFSAVVRENYDMAFSLLALQLCKQYLEQKKVFHLSLELYLILSKKF